MIFIHAISIIQIEPEFMKNGHKNKEFFFHTIVKFELRLIKAFALPNIY